MRMRHVTTCACVGLLTWGCSNESPSGDGGGSDGGGVITTATEGSDTRGDAAGSGGTATDSADGSGDGDGDGGPKFDVGSPDGESNCGDQGGGPGGTFSYIWIANSSEGTISKLNTQTVVEEGRYRVRPDSAGSPSRTSVSLSGDVAVANRLGGVTKIYANPADCVESNGMPGIQTSTGAADILDWGVEECVAWHTPLSYTSNRPMAWAQGEWDETSCSYINEKLWTAGANGVGTAEVLLLDGETGVVEQTIVIPEVASSIGIYGGAVDGDGHFWGIDTGGNQLIRVDRNTFAVQLIPGPATGGYGIAVDSQGRPWFCGGGGASRYDIGTNTWQSTPGNGSSGIGGCMTDGAGTLWHGRYADGYLVGIDTQSVTQVAEIALPSYVHGVSVDFDGYVWGVSFASTDAYRVDPATGTIDTYAGLVGAYTYSDMTGFALSSVGSPTG